MLLLLGLVLSAASAASVTCPIVVDARVPVGAIGADFDNGALPFNSAYDLGQNQTWASVLKFPKTPRSLFDTKQSKAVEVTLSDGSIFVPSATNVQRGFRRTELLPQPKNVSASVSGVKTWHLSIRRDEGRPLNYSHEYYLFWLEAADYSHNPFVIGTGTLFRNGDNQTTTSQAEQLWLRSNDASNQRTLWQTPFRKGVWHNMALTLDFDTNTVQMYYSVHQGKLTAQGGPVSNDNSNGGQFHIGMLKKPTGVGLSDISKQGFQESGIDEGMIFGGAFEEDSGGGCLSW